MTNSALIPNMASESPYLLDLDRRKQSNNPEYSSLNIFCQQTPRIVSVKKYSSVEKRVNNRQPRKKTNQVDIFTTSSAVSRRTIDNPISKLLKLPLINGSQHASLHYRNTTRNGKHTRRSVESHNNESTELGNTSCNSTLLPFDNYYPNSVRTNDSNNISIEKYIEYYCKDSSTIADDFKNSYGPSIKSINYKARRRSTTFENPPPISPSTTATITQIKSSTQNIINILMKNCETAQKTTIPQKQREPFREYSFKIASTNLQDCQDKSKTEIKPETQTDFTREGIQIARKPLFKFRDKKYQVNQNNERKKLKIQKVTREEMQKLKKTKNRQVSPKKNEFLEEAFDVATEDESFSLEEYLASRKDNFENLDFFRK